MPVTLPHVTDAPVDCHGRKNTHDSDSDRSSATVEAMRCSTPRQKGTTLKAGRCRSPEDAVTVRLNASARAQALELELRL